MLYHAIRPPIMHRLRNTADETLRMKSMSVLKIIILALGSLWFASVNVRSEVATTNSNDGQLFKFKFELNKPLVYAMRVKTKIISDEKIGDRSLMTRNTTESRYKIRLTPVSTNQDGTTTIYYEPFDYEQDVEAIGASGRVNTSYRGLNIISKQNDIVMVDTAKGIGVSEGNSLKVGLYPFLLSGYMDFNPAGTVTKYEGDLPFIDQWQETLQLCMGFFHVIFSTNTVSVGASWTNLIAYKDAFGVVFNGDGITETNIFTRESDSMTNNRPVVCFNLYKSGIQRDLSGYFELRGQRTSIVIPKRSGNANATFHFDQKMGRLIDMHETGSTADSVSMMYQGTPGISHHNSEREVTMQLVLP